MKSNRIDTHLRAQFGELYSQISESNKERCVMACLLYLFRGISSSNLTGQICKALGKKVSMEAFRAEMTGDGYLLKNIKTYLYYMHCHKLIGNERLERAYAKEFGLKKRDLRLLSFVSGPLLEVFQKYMGKYKALTAAAIDNALQRILSETEVYTAKFVRKKMSFIVKANNMEYDDLSWELSYKGMQSLLLMNPCIESRAHSTNIVKRSIHNAGINIINKYANTGRNRTVRQGDGSFASNTIPYEMIKENSAAMSLDFGYYTVTDIYGNQQVGTGVQTINDRFDLELSVKNLIGNVDGKRRKFLQLMMGEYDVDFTHWLRAKRVIQSSITNDKYQDKLGSNQKTYARLVCSYLKVPEYAGERYLARLQEQFCHYA